MLAVVVTASTKLKDICVYLDKGLVSMEQVNILFAGFVDDEAGVFDQVQFFYVDNVAGGTAGFRFA